MEVNGFVAKLKANNISKDITDLVKVYYEFKVILEQVSSKDRAPFSLNVLCTLCRNLDKAPKWRDSIDTKALLTLSIDCVREARAMERADRVKTLACIFHIHRHVVRQNVSIPPELVLKISFMPFELDSKHLLQEYFKTYWNILVDRLSYIERLRTKIPIIKLLPKLTEDILKITEIYDTVQYCTNVIVFTVKKLHFLYNEKHAKELNQVFTQIFAKLSTKDVKVFKKLVDTELKEVYVKLNECLYLIAENASKVFFKDCPLDTIVRTCISMVGHSPDLFHCLQTFYSNTFVSILTTNTDLNYSETVLNSLLVSFDTIEKLGYGRAMLATYPYLNQFTRLYIEFKVTNSAKKHWKDNFSVRMQDACLKIMLKLMERLQNCEQLLKCDNCLVKSGLHDSLRLSFLVKHFITVSLAQNILITEILPQINLIIDKQYKILSALKGLGCVNYEKCFRKLQTDIHNTAISLNKAQYFEFSIKLFNIYIKHEIQELSDEAQSRNISRALYNKGICELDTKLYKDALHDAFLSLVYSNDLSSEKYMGLVMDIKAKELKARSGDDDDDGNDSLQLVTVADACKMSVEENVYGNIEQFITGLNFSELLLHEFAVYAKLWPSVMPIAGVSRSLLGLSKGEYPFATKHEEAAYALRSVILQTPTVVRAISGEHFKGVIEELTADLSDKSLSADMKVVYASLLFLKTELELEAASQKYGWKSTEPIQNTDPDQIPANRTIPQEFVATRDAIRAVNLLAELSPDFNKVSNKIQLVHSLQIYQVYVQLLLHLARDVEALSLAHSCCLIADCVDDNEAFLRNAGTILRCGAAGEETEEILRKAERKAARCAGDAAITFVCDAAVYYSRSGSVGVAARLVQLAQAQILDAYEADPEVNLELAVGRLMEAQASLCRGCGPGVLTAVNGTLRHYLSIAKRGTKWHALQLSYLSACAGGARAALVATRALRDVRLLRRARAVASAAMQRAAAATRALLYADITDDNCFEDAEIKIDNRLKHFLGLQPSNEMQPYYTATEPKKRETFTPKLELETMLEVVFKKSQISPSIPCADVPAFKMPEFFGHAHQCDCYACSMPICYILACQTSGLEAAMYFRAKENDIARNYFNGVLKMFGYVEERFKHVKRRYAQVYSGFVVDTAMGLYWELYRKAKIRILVDLAFFELRNSDYEVADEHIVEIHEIVQELSDVNLYTSSDIMNLMTCSAQLRKIIKKPVELGLEAELEGLKLSPVKYLEPLKTPEAKPKKPPKAATKMIVKDEELPKKRKVIKLKLDEGSSEEKEVKKTSKHEFKVPLLTTKHVLEVATPRTRSTPKILVTQPADETVPRTRSKPNTTQDIATPNTTKQPDFFTPKESTPEQFFTPMTSVKTYTKTSLRRNIVKNLEQEFSTPISAQKENVKEARQAKEVKSNLEVPRRAKKKEVVNSLKRATSPGKLCKEPRELSKDSRVRRLRKPVNFSIDEEDNR